MRNASFNSLVIFIQLLKKYPFVTQFQEHFDSRVALEIEEHFKYIFE